MPHIANEDISSFTVSLFGNMFAFHAWKKSEQVKVCSVDLPDVFHEAGCEGTQHLPGVGKRACL